MTKIGDSAFKDCSGLTSVTIGNSVTEIGNYAFNGCSKLKKLVIEDGTKELRLGYNDEGIGYNNKGKGLFYDCPLRSLYLGRNLSYNTAYDYGYSPFYHAYFREVTISNTVTEIGEYTLVDCNYLTELYSLNPTPPTIKGGNSEYMIYNKTNVFVPQGSLSAYKSADTWKNFKNLQEFDPTGVETIKADIEKIDDTYHDIQGRKLNAPKNGLNIINGKKVLIRK